jgi:hemerythrin-like domain-containing protein
MEQSQTRNESDGSIEVLREHRRIKEFFDDELPYLLEENSQKLARKKIIEFVDMIRKHHAQEEKQLFPLALRARACTS